jgi:putative ABC transport system permease protein
VLFRLAIKTLLSDRGKLVAGIIGVTFSVVLANIQGGLFLGLIHKASTLVDRGHADIWVGGRGMHNVDFPHDIPRRWIQRIRGIDDVLQADPVTVGFSEMLLPSGSFEGVTVVGVEPGNSLGRVWKGAGTLSPEPFFDDLIEEEGVIVDECDSDRLEDPQVGDFREIGGLRARVIGKSRGILSFLVTPYIFTTLERAVRYTGKDPQECSYFLVKVREGADPASVCAEIQRRLPYTEAYTSQQYADVSINFWMTRTGIGISFGAAALLGLLVGLAMVGQTLYAMVLDRVNEFATLKALGASEREIVTILLSQAAGIATMGISVGLALTWIVNTFYDSPRASIEIPISLAVSSSAGVFMMCILASAAPYLRVRSVDAHTVLQG